MTHLPLTSRPSASSTGRVARPSFEDVPESRRRNMSAIKSRDTHPEFVVRRLLFHMGYRYRVHRSGLPGRPDIAFPSRRKVVFVHGCFWHRHSGCPNFVLPRERHDWWKAKLEANAERDARHCEVLKGLGWEPIIVWECELSSEPAVAARLRAFLGPTRPAKPAKSR